MSTLLKGCTIALTGTFADDENHASVGVKIKSNGGEYSTRLNGRCTHLVCYTNDFDLNAVKFKQAINNPDIKVVGFEWLLDSITSQKKLDEEKYKIGHSSIDDKDSKSKKRARNSTPVDDDKPDDDEEEEEDEEKPPEKKRKDSQKALSLSLRVPVDEEYAANTNENLTVHIDDDGIVFDAPLNQTVVGDNKNKFYLIQILSTSDGRHMTLTRWGRVGEKGQCTTAGNGSLDEAIKLFEKKFKDKSGLAWENRFDPPKPNKYAFIERDYAESDNESDDAPKKPSSKQKQDKKPQIVPESKLPKQVQLLMELIFNQQYFAATLNEMSYDAHKLPLGKLSKRTLKIGFEKLKALAEILLDTSAPGSQKEISELSDAFYTVIPHVFGRARPPTISSEERLKKEIALLESLSDMEIANEIMKESRDEEAESIHSLDRQFARLGLQEMTPLDSALEEYKVLKNYLIGSHGKTHMSFSYKVQNIFRIERAGETERFAKSRYAKIQGDRRLLWHGSRCTNYGGILSQGLRIAPPEAPVSGYMFGKGVYLADVSSKSANYCCAQSSGNVGLLLLCEVELGKPMLELTNAECGAGEEAKKKGLIATWGKGRIGPIGWTDASCVHPSLKGVWMPEVSEPPGPTTEKNASLYYNEYIAYDVAQIRLRYLLRVEIK